MVMPSLGATACASRIMSAARRRVPGSRQMSTSVARESALIGLNVRLPHSFSQISERMSSSTGALRPARVNAPHTRSTRGVVVPSSSPIGKRSPSMCLTTPGATSSAAG